MRWPIVIRRVEGHSMEPTLKQGAIIFATPLLSVGKGDVVVAQRDDKDIIKRATKIKDEKYFLEGDNSSHSRDSRRFGLVEKSEVLGRVIPSR